MSLASKVRPLRHYVQQLLSLALSPRLSQSPHPVAVVELWQATTIETILVFTAVVLRRRVVVLAKETDTVTRLTRAVTHLDPTGIDYTRMYPLLPEVRVQGSQYVSQTAVAPGTVVMDCAALHVQASYDQLPAGAYILGTTNANIESQPELYDVLVDGMFQSCMGTEILLVMHGDSGTAWGLLVGHGNSGTASCAWRCMLTRALHGDCCQ